MGDNLVSSSFWRHRCDGCSKKIVPTLCRLWFGAIIATLAVRKLRQLCVVPTYSNLLRLRLENGPMLSLFFRRHCRIFHEKMRQFCVVFVSVASLQRLRLKKNVTHSVSPFFRMDFFHIKVLSLLPTYQPSGLNENWTHPQCCQVLPKFSCQSMKKFGQLLKKFSQLLK